MMNDYASFSIDDFIADHFFQQWVKNPDEVSNAWWHNWMLAHPDKRELVNSAAQFIADVKFDEDLPDHETIEKSVGHLFKRIALLEERFPAATPGKHPRRTKGFWLLIALAFLFLLLALYLLLAGKWFF